LRFGTDAGAALDMARKSQNADSGAMNNSQNRQIHAKCCWLVRSMNKVPLKKLLINFAQAENVCPQAVEYTQTHVQETRHTVYHETNQKWNTQNLKPLFLQNLWTNISRHTAINKKLKIQTTKRKRVC